MWFVATITLRRFVAGSGRRPPHQNPRLPQRTIVGPNGNCFELLVKMIVAPAKSDSVRQILDGECSVLGTVAILRIVRSSGIAMSGERPRKGCESLDVADIVVARLLPEIAHGHVFDHALA
jgi:hypothetical protein